MNRSQLAHVRGAACQITGDPDMLVIGSQSILASTTRTSCPRRRQPPSEPTSRSSTTLVDAKAHQVDGAIGELSPFHERFGYYAQGVSVSTAVLPLGWRNRPVRWRSSSTGQAAPVFLEKHDLVVSKLVALREKDMAFAEALIEAGLVDVAELRSRVQELPAELDSRAVARIVSFLGHRTSPDLTSR